MNSEHPQDPTQIIKNLRENNNHMAGCLRAAADNVRVKDAECESLRTELEQVKRERDWFKQEHERLKKEVEYRLDEFRVMQKQLAASEASRKELVEVLKWAKAQIEGLARRSFVGPKEAQEWIDNCQALKAANKALANAELKGMK